MKRRTIHQLADELLHEIEKLRYARISITHYEQAFARIKKYIAKNGEIFLSEELTERYFHDTYAWDVNSKVKPSAHVTSQLRVFRIMTFYERFGRIPKKTSQTKEPPSCFKEPFLLHLKECVNRNLSDKTIDSKTRDIYDLLAYAESKGINDVADLNIAFLDEYLIKRSGEAKNAMRRILSSIRCFLRSMYSNNIIKSDISVVIPAGSKYPVKPVQKLWTSDEVKNLLQSVERSDSIGKRDYAIILLVVRYGIRASDIRNLKLTDINWDSMTIQFCQGKTSVTNVLPILDDIGWALADWITNARPKQASTNHVFTRLTAPYCGMADIWKVFNRHMANARITNIGCGKSGPHSLRHALASGMLAGQVPLPVITSVLGHSSSASTMVYLHSDVEGLRQCALDVEGDVEGVAYEG
jgi:site-specific recombinase XerD